MNRRQTCAPPPATPRDRSTRGAYRRRIANRQAPSPQVYQNLKEKDTHTIASIDGSIVRRFVSAATVRSIRGRRVDNAVRQNRNWRRAIKLARWTTHRREKRWTQRSSDDGPARCAIVSAQGRGSVVRQRGRYASASNGLIWADIIDRSMDDGRLHGLVRSL